MKFKKLFLPLIALVTSIVFFGNVSTKQVNASVESFSFYLEDIIQNVHDNTLDDISSNPLFTYGLRHGSISTSSSTGVVPINPGCIKYDAVDGGGKFIYSSSYASFVADCKTTIRSFNDDRFIVKFVANDNIIIKTSVDSNDISATTNDTQIDHYILTNYNETALIEYPKAYSTINNLASSDVKTFSHTFFINKGQTFYWQWGFQFGSAGDYREFDIGKSTCGYKFEILKDDYVQKEVKNEEYKYLDLIEKSAQISGNNLIPGETVFDQNQTLVEIGFRHGSIAEGRVDKFSSHTPTCLGTPNDNEPKTTFMQNWRLTSVNGDGAIVQIKALKKIRLSVSRQFFGNDSLAGLTINIYKNNTLEKSNEFNGSTDKLSDFSFSIVLEANDVFSWEMIHYGTGFGILSMGDDGTQYTSLPLFKAIEYGEVIEHTVELNSLSNKIISTGHIEQEIDDSLGMIKVVNGQVELNNIIDASIGGDYVGSTTAKVKTNGEIVLNPSSALTFVISTQKDLAVYLNFTLSNANFNLNIYAYQYVEKVGLTHRLFDLNNIDDEKVASISSPLILGRNDVVYIEFVSNSTNVIYNEFKGFTFAEKAKGDGVSNTYPFYDSNDFTSRNFITHSEIAYETARTRSNTILARDLNINLLTGQVSEEKKDGSYPFSYVEYESGEYIEKTIDCSMRLTGSESDFDGDNFAAVEPNRIKTSKANSVIYKLTATVNTSLQIHHSATNGGWIKDSPTEQPEISFEYIQTNGTQYKLLDKKDVNSTINPIDAFAYTFELKAGDTGYLIFKSDAAYQRNLNIEFNFTSLPESYNPAIRDQIFSDVGITFFSYDVISDMIRNDNMPVNYEDSIEVNFAHGDAKNPEKFNFHTGDGNGSANDALYTDGLTANKAGFQRWQIKAGRLSDNAIMIFKATKNIHLTLKNEATKESWASFSSFKYYVVDTDGFYDYKEERYVSSDLEADYFGYDIHLLSGQSLLISYQSNDESSHAVVDLVYKIIVDTTTFDVTKVNDFTAARNLQAIKNTYQYMLHIYMNELNPDDYSLSNWSKIETLVDTYDTGIDVLTDRESVTDLYYYVTTQINNILTLDEEAVLLEQTKTNALYQARKTIEDNRQYFLDKTISAIEQRYSSLEWKIKSSKSITSINVALSNFQSYILSLSHDKVNLQNGLIIGFSILGMLVIGTVAIAYVIHKNSTKKLLVVNRSISTLKLENNVEYLVPQKRAKWKVFLAYMKKYWPLYLMLVPMVVYIFIFSYIPMGGLTLAFKDFDFRQGIWSSPWASTNGVADPFKYFRQLFENPEFLNSVLITLKISGLRLLCGFFVPIVMTILLTEIKSKRFSKGFQIISYLPHFVSWIVIYGILVGLTTSGSPVQSFFASIFGKEVGFFSDPNIFLWLIIFSQIWKEAGWSTIIYFAAAASINPELYEACNVDGASRWKRILKVTLPGLVPAISINLILQASGFVFGGFEQIFAMTGNGVNQSILPYVNITEIFLYKAGITSFEYSLATVVGLLNSIISFVLVLISNFVIKKIGGDGLW